VTGFGFYIRRVDSPLESVVSGPFNTPAVLRFLKKALKTWNLSKLLLRSLSGNERRIKISVKLAVRKAGGRSSFFLPLVLL
jgi:hypothetical protein